VTPGWWRDDAASRPLRLPDKIGTCQANAVAHDDRQRQPRAMPSGRTVLGPAGAPARRQGGHGPGARMDTALHLGPLSEGGRRAGGCVCLQCTNRRRSAAQAMNKAPDQRVAGRSWGSIRSTVAPAVIEHGSQVLRQGPPRPARKARPERGQPGASILEHREACSPWGERGNHGPFRGRAQAGVGSAHAPQAPSTQRASRLQAVESPCCGDAGAAGPFAGCDAGTRLATNVHTRSHAGGCGGSGAGTIGTRAVRADGQVGDMKAPGLTRLGPMCRESRFRTPRGRRRAGKEGALPRRRPDALFSAAGRKPAACPETRPRLMSERVPSRHSSCVKHSIER
jgi:hypothetical protein